MNSNELLTKLGVSFTADGDFVYENGVGLVGRAIDREIAEVVEQRDGYARMAENEAASVQALSAQLAEAVELLEELADCEQHYRTQHSVHGYDSKQAAYAWDQMRKRGDDARAFIERHGEKKP